jgi:hypothetical protein
MRDATHRGEELIPHGSGPKRPSAQRTESRAQPGAPREPNRRTPGSTAIASGSSGLVETVDAARTDDDKDRSRPGSALTKVGDDSFRLPRSMPSPGSCHAHVYRPRRGAAGTSGHGHGRGHERACAHGGSLPRIRHAPERRADARRHCLTTAVTSSPSARRATSRRRRAACRSDAQPRLRKCDATWRPGVRGKRAREVATLRFGGLRAPSPATLRPTRSQADCGRRDAPRSVPLGRTGARSAPEQQRGTAVALLPPGLAPGRQRGSRSRAQAPDRVSESRRRAELPTTRASRPSRFARNCAAVGDDRRVHPAPRRRAGPSGGSSTRHHQLGGIRGSARNRVPQYSIEGYATVEAAAQGAMHSMQHPRVDPAYPRTPTRPRAPGKTRSLVEIIQRQQQPLPNPAAS